MTRKIKESYILTRKINITTNNNIWTNEGGERKAKVKHSKVKSKKWPTKLNPQ